jgi:hypothetical protein
MVCHSKRGIKMEKDTNINVTMFYGNEEPKNFSVGSLWVNETGIYVAKKQNDDIVWVEKR